MATVVLFPSVLGLRRGVAEAAQRLRGAGHTVHAVDLYGGGLTFADYEPAIAHLRGLGYAQLLGRARSAVEHLPDGLVFAGFSAGAAPAELLAATRPGARGALLLHGALPVAQLGLEAWPGRVPVQVHCMLHDPFRDDAGIDGLTRDVERAGAAIERFDYPGDGHLFADPSLAGEYDEVAAELMWARVLRFLARTDAASRASTVT